MAPEATEEREESVILLGSALSSLSRVPNPPREALLRLLTQKMCEVFLTRPSRPHSDA